MNSNAGSYFKFYETRIELPSMIEIRKQTHVKEMNLITAQLSFTTSCWLKSYFLKDFSFNLVIFCPRLFKNEIPFSKSLSFNTFPTHEILLLTVTATVRRTCECQDPETEATRNSSWILLPRKLKVTTVIDQFHHATMWLLFQFPLFWPCTTFI